jgi:hypothetical protein
VAVVEVKSQEADRPDHLAALDRHDPPADRVPGTVTLLEALERALGLGQGPEGRHVVVPRDLRVPQDPEKRGRVAEARRPEAKAPGD